jgi:hyperosmotically inducible periplasmic protein
MSSLHSITVVLGLTVGMALAFEPGTVGAATADDPEQAHSDGLRAAVADTATTAKVKEHLATDKRLENSSISVTTTNGVVTLTGTAPTADASSAAEDVARSVSGVKSVDNQVSAPSALESAAGKVSHAARQTQREVSDEWITTKIKTQLFTDRSVQKDSDISVKTSHGVVTLSGTAASRDALDHARAVASHVQGVKSVDASGLRLASNQ